MIRRITGTAIEVSSTHLIVETGGIGYFVHTTPKLGVAAGAQVVLHTHLAIRENAHDLYGFDTTRELEFFELLLTLPKVGPKTALAILSQADVTLIQNAILSQDPEHLSKLGGMSKKTAEKITLGLKDTFEDVAYTEHAETQTNTSLMKDAIDALIALGYPQSDARKAVQKVCEDNPSYQGANDVVKGALKVLGGI
jgi:holliday junction DNA helicase RuvA